jgi:hypothetical protein
MILSEGDTQSVFASIVSGVVKLTKSLDDGRQHIVGLLFAPDFIGRAYHADNPYFAEAAKVAKASIRQGSLALIIPELRGHSDMRRGPTPRGARGLFMGAGTPGQRESAADPGAQASQR